MRKWFDCPRTWVPRAGAIAAAIALAILATGCARRADWADVRDVTPEFLADRAAAEPAVAADARGSVALTWTTSNPPGVDAWVAISRDGGASFSAPARINARAGAVRSDAENRPMAWLGDGRVLLAWSEARRDGSGAVDLLVRTSDDDGASFSAPVVINDDLDDRRDVFHGRAAITALHDGALFAAWCDDRERGRATDGATALFSASSGDGGRTWSDNRPITVRAHDGSRPAISVDETGGVTIAYRTATGGTAIAESHDGGTNFRADIAVDGERTDRVLDDSLTGTANPHIVAWGGAMLAAVEARPRADTTRRVIAIRSVVDDARAPWVFLGADADQAWLAPAGPAALVVWREGGAARGRVRVVRVTRP
ncbi:MAG: exo-alpha-sialidase [Candidatus Eisenbacteria bacterium]|nr:exo-alpha-sialidase [Candidatus Eisenbacteria bacterium]